MMCLHSMIGGINPCLSDEGKDIPGMYCTVQRCRNTKSFSWNLRHPPLTDVISHPRMHLLLRFTHAILTLLPSIGRL
jgi:hypothetical protein